MALETLLIDSIELKQELIGIQDDLRNELKKLNIPVLNKYLDNISFDYYDVALEQLNKIYLFINPIIYRGCLNFFLCLDCFSRRIYCLRLDVQNSHGIIRFLLTTQPKQEEVSMKSAIASQLRILFS